MRWFIVFLLIANVAFFFWVQQESRKLETATLVPPDIGQLHLVDKDEPSLLQQDGDLAQVVEQPALVDAPVLEPEPVESVPVEAVQTEPVLPKAEQIAPDSKPGPEALAPEVTAATEVAEPESPLMVEVESSTLLKQIEMPVEPTESEVVPEQEVADLVEEQPLVSEEVSSIDQVAEVTAEAATEALAPSFDEPSVSESPEAPAQPVAVCYRVGPLKAEDADKLIAGLSDKIELLSDDTEPTQALIGYYVLIPPLGSIAEGNKKLEELKEAGIADTWLFRRGEYQFAISLGLFSRQSSAERHAANVGKKGFDVEVRQRTALRDRRWLQLKNSDGSELDLELPEGTATESQPCP